MDEYIDTLNPDATPTGRAELKSVIHQKGYYHNTAQVWFYTDNNEILLAQRSANKVICPNLWDVSVAGHVDSGETIARAAVRETQEELGLHIAESELVPIGVFKCFQNYPSVGLIDHEFHNTFIAQLQVPLTHLALQPEEVQAVKLVSFSEFEHLLKNSHSNHHFLSTHRTYYRTVLKTIRRST